jgi:hypothetical protein
MRILIIIELKFRKKRLLHWVIITLMAQLFCWYSSQHSVCILHVACILICELTDCL